MTDLDDIRVRAGWRASVHVNVVATGASRQSTVTKLHVRQSLGRGQDLLTDAVLQVDWLTIDVPSNQTRHRKTLNSTTEQGEGYWEILTVPSSAYLILGADILLTIPDELLHIKQLTSLVVNIYKPPVSGSWSFCIIEWTVMVISILLLWARRPGIRCHTVFVTQLSSLNIFRHQLKTLAK